MQNVFYCSHKLIAIPKWIFKRPKKTSHEKLINTRLGPFKNIIFIAYCLCQKWPAKPKILISSPALCSKIIRCTRSDIQKKGVFRVFKIFLWSNLGHESLLFKQSFPQNIWISSSTLLGEHPNMALRLGKVSHSRDWKLCYLFRLFLWLENHL